MVLVIYHLTVVFFLPSSWGSRSWGGGGRCWAHLMAQMGEASAEGGLRLRRVVRCVQVGYGLLIC